MSAVILSRGLGVDVCSDGRCASLAESCPSPVFPNFWGLATLMKLNTEMSICHTKFGIVTLIFVPLT